MIKKCPTCAAPLTDDGMCKECLASLLEQAGRKEMSNTHYDPVERPAHYNMGEIECIDYIKQVLGLDGFIAYCHGNMLKYQHRYRYKQKPVEDMKKAQWYLDKMVEAMQEKHR